MAWWLMAPIYYLKPYWWNMTEIMWHSLQDTISQETFKITIGIMCMNIAHWKWQQYLPRVNGLIIYLSLQGLAIYRGYPAKGPYLPCVRHGGLDPFSRIPSRYIYIYIQDPNLVISVPADDLPPVVARSSASTVLILVPDMNYTTIVWL